MLGSALLLASGRLGALLLAVLQLRLLAGLSQEATGLVLLHASLWASWSTAIDLGTGQALLRLCGPLATPELGLGPAGERLVRGAIRLRLALGGVVLGAQLLLVVLLGDAGEAWLVAATLHLPAQAFGALQTPFLLRGRPLPLVGARFGGLLLSLAGTALLRIAGTEGPGAYLGVQALGWLLYFWLLWRRAGIPLRGEAAAAREVLPESVLLGLGSFVRGLYFHGGQLLVRLLAPAELARFAVPYRVFQVALLVPQSLGDLLLGPLTRLNGSDPCAASAEVRGLGWRLFLLGLLTAGAGALLAGPVLALVGGGAYARSAPVLGVLLLAVPLVHAASVLLTAALAGGRLLEALLLSLAGLAAAVLFGLALIPGGGAAGAAWAAVATEALVLAGAAWLVRLNSAKTQTEAGR